MRNLIILLTIFRFSIGYSQEKIFKDYDFQSGEYALIFVDVTEPEEDYYANRQERSKAIKQSAFIDSKVHFIIDSISTLLNIKDTWSGKKTYEMHECWYNYFIYLTKNDTVLSVMKINFECNELIVDNNAYVFDSANVIKFLGLADTIVKTDYRFYEDKGKAEKAWKNVETDSSVVLEFFMKPLWVDYEGKFKIEYIDSSNIFGEPLEILLKEKIKDEYPDENFKLKFSGLIGGMANEPNIFYYYIICNKSLYDKFKLFRIDKKWKFYDSFGMTVYRRKPKP